MNGADMVKTGLAALGAALAAAWFAAPAGAGQTTFTEHRFAVSGKLDGHLAGDVDGDGRIDLVLLEGRRVILYRQGPEGFRRWPDQVFLLDGRAQMLTLGDRLDRPGRELVFAGAGGVFAYGVTEGSFDPTPVPWVEGETALRAGAGAPLLREFFADLTGDGRADLLVPVPGRYVLLRQEEDGAFTRQAQLEVEPDVHVRVPAGGHLGSLGTTIRYPVPFVTDFDGDGRKDVVVRRRAAVQVFLGREEGAFSPKADFEVRTESGEQTKDFGGRMRLDFEAPLLVEDLGGDGVADLLACMPLKGEAVAFTRTGGRELGKPGFVFRMDGWPLGAMVRDLDGLNGPDLVIGGVGKIGIWSILKVFLTKEIIIYAFFFLNRGEGRFDHTPDRTWEVVVPLKFATTAKGFRMGTTLAANFSGDFNGDGRRDLILKRGNVILDIFAGGGDTVFGRKPWMSLTIPDAERYRYVFPEALDVNGDGVSDILLHYRDWEEKRDALVLFASKAE